MTLTAAQLEQARQALLNAGTKPERVEPMLRYVDLALLPTTATGALEPTALAAAATAAAAAAPELTRTGRQPNGARPAPTAGGSTDDVAATLAHMRASVGLPPLPTV